MIYFGLDLYSCNDYHQLITKDRMSLCMAFSSNLTISTSKDRISQMFASSSNHRVMHAEAECCQVNLYSHVSHKVLVLKNEL